MSAVCRTLFFSMSHFQTPQFLATSRIDLASSTWTSLRISKSLLTVSVRRAAKSTWGAACAAYGWEACLPGRSKPKSLDLKKVVDAVKCGGNLLLRLVTGRRFACQPLFRGCLGGVAGQCVDFGPALMWLRIAHAPFRRLAEVAQRIGILAGGQAFPRQDERGTVEQIRGSGILPVELVRAAESLVSRQIFTELREHRAIEEVQLEDVRPPLDGFGDGRARLLKAAHSIVGERQVVLHLRPFRG